MPGVARLGDGSSHGGSIITAGSTVRVNGILVARVGDMHSCPISGHGTTAIVAGSASVSADGELLARIGDHAGCGASITGGSADVSSG